jgi:hypothetical protein
MGAFHPSLGRCVLTFAAGYMPLYAGAGRVEKDVTVLWRDSAALRPGLGLHLQDRVPL